MSCLACAGHAPVRNVDKERYIESNIESISSAQHPEIHFFDFALLTGAPSDAMKCFKSYAQQNRLILSFHYYSPPSTASWLHFVFTLDRAELFSIRRRKGFIASFFCNFLVQGAMEEDIQLAKKNAAKFGGIPIFLSEFWEVWRQPPFLIRF